MHKKICKVVVVTLLLLAATVALVPAHTEAYVRGISRANCGTVPYVRNESITWENTWTTRHYWTNSYHYFNSTYKHYRTNGWNYSWSDCAGDWDPYRSNYDWWQVVGRHWYWTQTTGLRELQYTYAGWCNVLKW